MIIHGYNKLQQIYKGQNVYMVFHGENLIYNYYVTTDKNVITLPNNKSDSVSLQVKANAQWSAETT